MDFVAFAVDAQLIPDIGLKGVFGTDRAAEFAISDSKEAERVTDAAGANVIIVLFVLNAEGDPGHLFVLAGHHLDAGMKNKVIEHFALVDQHRKTVINPLARKLSEHGLLDQLRAFVR